MHTTVKLSSDFNRAIMVRSFHDRSKKRSKAPQQKNRTESEFGTKSYRDGLQRAFNRAKEQIYFNPDMQFFVTLTYAGIEDDYTKVMADLKYLCQQEKRHGQTNLKYIYVFEWQKRGSLHVHMITNSELTTYTNRNGYRSLTYWPHGYTSMLTIKDFDNNFRPHLYLFKYMKKAPRIGKSFIHASRNLNTSITLENSTIQLAEWRTVNMEYTHTQVQTTNFHYFKNYLQFDDTIESRTNYITGEIKPCVQVQSNSIQELAKLAEKHIPICT